MNAALDFLNSMIERMVERAAADVEAAMRVDPTLTLREAVRDALLTAPAALAVEMLQRDGGDACRQMLIATADGMAHQRKLADIGRESR